MTASVQPRQDASAQYLLRVADTCLILGQRLSEWCGHAPIIEEDIALSNTALDLIGQARALLTHAGRSETGQSLDEDQLAFLREERHYLNVTLVELPRGDFAFTVLRNVMVATFLKLLWQRLARSSDAELAAIAGKAVKEARYHQQHAGDWVLRLADGTAESRQRTEAALAQLWRYTPELLEDDAVDEQAAASGLGPRWSELREDWLAEMGQLLTEAQLSAPKDSAFRSTGKRGVHSEHLGHLLTEMQHLQRSFPGGVW
jgi:ring-1,2-phenylacetyl-CoA epoxidase subunit PaaC